MKNQVERKLEKLERKDPLKRFSEKVAVQKTLQGICQWRVDSIFLRR